MGDRLVNFDANHHETTRLSCSGKLRRWKEDTLDNKSRCKTCWIRAEDCFCKTLVSKKQELQAYTHDCNFTILMYYHYMELGRSANTAHVFEAICPEITNPLIFVGDVEEEAKLMEDLRSEHENNEPITCVLYPTPDAMFLSDWIKQRPDICKNKPIRLVALDGTYPCARRQLKHITSCCALNKVPTPLVKLDLTNGECKSAIAGIMSQPGKDKICTFQALVMAMREMGVNPAFCDHLTTDLEDWLAHILKSKIKFGKSQPRRSNQEVDTTPADYIQNILRKQPPPLGDNSRLAVNKRVEDSSYNSNRGVRHSTNDMNITSMGDERRWYPTTDIVLHRTPTRVSVHDKHRDIYTKSTAVFSVHCCS